MITALCASWTSLVLSSSGCCTERQEALARVTIALCGTPSRGSSPRFRCAGIRYGSSQGPHRSKPEHDDVLAIARATGLPIRSVAEQALSECGRSHEDQAGGGQL